jgi:hypothetical protein
VRGLGVATWLRIDIVGGMERFEWGFIGVGGCVGESG